MKPCSKCKAPQPLGCYRKGSLCLKCEASYRAAKRYGLTPREHFELYKEASGLCAICSEERELVVDHCHKSGQVRGLLCNQCNTALGLLQDNPAIIKRAAKWCQPNDTTQHL